VVVTNTDDEMVKEPKDLKYRLHDVDTLWLCSDVDSYVTVRWRVPLRAFRLVHEADSAPPDNQRWYPLLQASKCSTRQGILVFHLDRDTESGDCAVRICADETPTRCVVVYAIPLQRTHPTLDTGSQHIVLSHTMQHGCDTHGKPAAAMGIEELPQWRGVIGKPHLDFYSLFGPSVVLEIGMRFTAELIEGTVTCAPLPVVWP